MAKAIFQIHFCMLLIVTNVWSATKQSIVNVKRTQNRDDAPEPIAFSFDENGKYWKEEQGDLSKKSVAEDNQIGHGFTLIVLDNLTTGDESPNMIQSKKMARYDYVSRRLLSSDIASTTSASAYLDCWADSNCTSVGVENLNNDGGNYTNRWNESYEDYLNQIEEFIFPRTWTWILIFIHSLVFVIGLVGNTLVCVAVYRNHTMRTVTNYFIVNLAVADFMVILFCLPPTLIWDVTMTWFFGMTMCKIVLYLQTVSVTVSVLTLTFISVDRWYAICYPLKFKSTTGRAKTAIFIIWLVALLFDIPELVVYRTRKPNLRVDTIYFTQCSTSWSRRADTSWTLLKMILLYGVPLIFMSATYCQIVRVLWKSGCGTHQPIGTSAGTNRSVTAFPNTNVNLEGQLRSRKKAAKMLVAVVVMFAFCYFPVHLLSTLRIIINLTNSDMNRALSLISHWLCYANSAVNPIIYNFMSGKFRKEFRRAFDCCSSGEGHPGYEMNSVCCKNTTRETGLGSNYSRSFRRTNTTRRTWVQGKSSDERRSTRSSLIKMDL